MGLPSRAALCRLFAKGIVVHRTVAIEKLELKLFDVLESTMPAGDAMRTSIGYFDHCEPEMLDDLLTMPEPFWRDEVTEIQQRLSEQENTSEK